MANVSRGTIEAIVRQLLRETNGSKEGVADAVVAALTGGKVAAVNAQPTPKAAEPAPKKSELVVSISARHIHLTDADVE
ncbi:MAG: hypothetical protein KIG81_04515, partial [Thermoguttaceae bacterium]|nr:hypothetical protein [Thermoguttaceae bacterium]